MNSRYLGLVVPFLSFSILFFPSLIILELGIYTDELEVFTYSNGAIYVYTFYFLFMISIYYFLFNLLSISKLNLDISGKYETYIITIFILMLCFYSVPIFYYGPSFMIGFNRYQFMDLPFVSIFNIKAIISINTFFLGAIIGCNGEKSKLASILLLVLLFVSICYGEKGTGPILIITYSISGYFCFKNTRISFKKLLLVLLFFASILGLIYALQIVLGGGNADIIERHFHNRLGRQSQLYWSLYEYYFGGVISSSNIEMEKIFGSIYDSETKSTMRYMMELVMPRNKYIAHTGSLTGGYPSVLFLLVDNFYALILISFIFGLVYIIPLLSLFLYINKFSELKYLAPMLVFPYTVHLKVFQTGNLSQFLNIKYIAFLMFSTILIVIYKSIQIKRKRYNG